jgi:hypothetical protein
MFVNLEKRRAETAGSSDKEALMTAGASSSDDGEDAYEAPPAAAEEMDLLVQLEIEMHSLAERRYGVESGMDHEELVRTVSRMNSLRIQIVLLRLGLGMDAVTDSDVVNGVNYMEDDTGSMG